MTGPDATVASEYDYQTHNQRVDRTISLRQASMRRDLGRLHRWLGSDHVKPYWELDRSLPAFRRLFDEKLAEDHLTPYIGCLDHVPMSYWECYWAAEDDVANYYDADATDQGIHLLIGPEEYLGRGYALALLRAVVAMQFRHPETDRVIAEPDVRNERAVRVFEQCGFESRETFYFDEEAKDALLMVCERERFETTVLADGRAIPTQEVSTDD